MTVLNLSAPILLEVDRYDFKVQYQKEYFSKSLVKLTKELIAMKLRKRILVMFHIGLWTCNKKVVISL
jgi:hypothetical protein